MSIYNHHFFASNVLEWRTTNDELNVADLILYFTKKKLPFNLFYIPLPETAEYTIENYQPQLIEAMKLLSFEDTMGDA